MGKQIICLDFDGVLHSYTSGWQGADQVHDDPVPGAIEFIEEAVKHFEVHIFSSRSHQAGGMEVMRSWLLYHMTEKFGSDPKVMKIFRAIVWPVVKPPALMSIDDRGFCFTGTFPKIEEIQNFKPWNKP